jgi:hypothetical protein
LIAIVLDVAPDKCQSVLTAIQSSKGRELTLLHLVLVVTQHFRQINCSKMARKLREEGIILIDAFQGKDLEPINVLVGKLDQKVSAKAKIEVSKGESKSGKTGHFSMRTRKPIKMSFCWEP